MNTSGVPVLTCLRIRQLAIVSELDVAFGPGLNVVTGETGAGKSILVNALKLVLGGRGRPDMVRAGAEQAEVEALFEVGDDPAIRQRLDALGLPADDELVIRRAIAASGRSRAYVNGRLATATQLGILAAGLVDISSQHEHHTLVDPATHLGWLDAFAELGPQASRVAELHGRLTGALRELRSERARLADRVAREDLLRYQLGEIERAGLRAGEEDDLGVEIARLRNSERLARAARGAEHALYGGGDAVAARLARVAVDLGDAARLDPALAPWAERVAAARIELEDVAVEVGRYARHLDGDPQRLAEAEERLQLLKRLARRYGGTVEAALAHAAGAEAELAHLGDLDEHLAALDAQVEGARREAAAVARELSIRRRQEAERLGEAITARLEALGMGGARVDVAVSALAEGEEAEGAEVLGARLSATGIDRVEFLIAPNPGEEPRPLRRVASGGELSRALLALKRVLSGIGPVGTYVFDEVDTGVGGAVAEAIGLELREVGRHHQVLCITHLPQVAALGHAHLRVRKSEVEGRTVSTIARLDATERVEELARMLGGLRVTETTRRAAAEMLTARADGLGSAEAAA